MLVFRQLLTFFKFRCSITKSLKQFDTIFRFRLPGSHREASEWGSRLWRAHRYRLFHRRSDQPWRRRNLRQLQR